MLWIRLNVFHIISESKSFRNFMIYRIYPLKHKTTCFGEISQFFFSFFSNIFLLRAQTTIDFSFLNFNGEMGNNWEILFIYLLLLELTDSSTKGEFEVCLFRLVRAYMPYLFFGLELYGNIIRIRGKWKEKIIVDLQTIRDRFFFSLRFFLYLCKV